MIRCRACHAWSENGVRFCQSCGALLEPAPAAATLPFKNEATAIFAAALPGVILMGIGQMYLAKFKRGFLIMFTGIATGIVFILAGFSAFYNYSFPVAASVGSFRIALWGWQIIDARKLARKYNGFLKDTEKPPW
jgi:TM2 domain-containing membrane protein YozV